MSDDERPAVYPDAEPDRLERVVRIVSACCRGDAFWMRLPRREG